MVAFERFLARLVKRDPAAWIIKGGLALQLRLGDRARTTKDIDAAARAALNREQATTRLRRAVSVTLADWFEFEAGEPGEEATGAPAGGLRFPIRCLLDGRTFETFHLDIGLGDPILEAADDVTAPPLLRFAGIRPSKVPCYPLSAQIAEKVHAYTRPYTGGASSRVRDLVDILLTASLGRLGSLKLCRAFRATFEARGTHALPTRFPKGPANWSGPYRRLARELRLDWQTLNDAEDAAARFLNPVLRGNRARAWNPASWSWD